MATSPARTDKPRTREVQSLVEQLLDEDGLVAYARGFTSEPPDEWSDEEWDSLRAKLWEDCYDGDRYYWQPLVPMLQSLYESQAAHVGRHPCVLRSTEAAAS